MECERTRRIYIAVVTIVFLLLAGGIVMTGCFEKLYD
jgi:hypothetical protein